MPERYNGKVAATTISCGGLYGQSNETSESPEPWILILGEPLEEFTVLL